MIKFRSVFLFLFIAASALAAPASDAAIPVFGSANPKGGLTLSTPTQIVILLTLLTLLPAVAGWMGGRDFSGLPPINGPACLVSLAGGAVLASCCWT